MEQDFLLIGIDGGATKVSAWEILYDERHDIFNLGTLHSQKSYNEIPGFLADFKALPLAEQIAQRDRREINLSDTENQQEAVYVEACAQVTEMLARDSGKEKILLGLGMPGLKTADLRGISVVANGPRMIHFSDLLEKRLALKNIHFLAPIHHIGSDADYCGIGENYSAEGLFRDAKTAYYLGGGTGVADAIKLNGQLLPFDAIKNWLAKSWEMKSTDGRSLERFASAGGIQSIYAAISGRQVSELNAEKIYPLQIAALAQQGHTHAVKTFDLVLQQLSSLLYERITTLYAGWQGYFTFINPNRPALAKEHPFKGLLFERIILGQRLGELFGSEQGQQILARPLFSQLAKLIKKSKILDSKAKKYYSNLESIIQISRLREAPALGAGIDAYLTYKSELA